MSDPRLDSSHLEVARHDQYEATIDEMLEDRGPVTSDADPLVKATEPCSSTHCICARRDVRSNQSCRWLPI